MELNAQTLSSTACQAAFVIGAGNSRKIVAHEIHSVPLVP
jgi:hypothetical protein